MNHQCYSQQVFPKATSEVKYHNKSSKLDKLEYSIWYSPDFSIVEIIQIKMSLFISHIQTAMVKNTYFIHIWASNYFSVVIFV